MKVGVITHIGKEAGGLNLLYPLYKYGRDLLSHGISIFYTKNYLDNQLDDCDIIILIHRCINIEMTKKTWNANQVVENMFEPHIRKGKKIILFDTGDSSGTRMFEYIPYVDAFWKKQIYKDKFKYTENNGDKSVRCWVNETNLNEEQYFPCEEKYLSKIAVAWNIGLCDYRPYHRFLGFLTNRFFENPKFTDPKSYRPYDTVFRGTVKYNGAISQQRMIMQDILTKINKKSILIGGRVKKSRFLDEIKLSKFTVSPFGWGEICYRDFETIISGSALIKPEMSHLETFPNVFIDNETYIPISWNLDELKYFFEDKNDNLRNVEIAINAQNTLKRYFSEKELFLNHFINLLNRT